MKEIKWYKCSDCSTMIKDGLRCSECYKKMLKKFREDVDKLK